MKRGSGVLMHISSLPGKFGIGTFGEESYKFVDFLRNSGMRYWQILPLGQTGYGDSPYQCFTAFAGNPYFIDFDLLKKDNLLKEGDYRWEKYGDNEERINYGMIYNTKYKVLKKAYENYKNRNDIKDEVEKFKKENSFWLNNYSIYMALKEEFKYVSWYNWDEEIRFREEAALKEYEDKLKDIIEYWNFVQYVFFKQWSDLKKYANSYGIKIIGDIPIYVSEDSVDSWSYSENFKIDKKKLNPITVAGCPPDSFSPTGQLWGNVLYDWDYMKKDKYKWWQKRIQQNLQLYDILRIDHFRGFESYWEVPYGEKTAVNGKWSKGPGMDFFKVINKELGEIDIIAEDLGFLTKETMQFIKETKFPGMKILQYAFDGSNDNIYLPHNYEKRCVAYTGTHDNDTSIGWINTTGNKYEVDNAKYYLGLNHEEGYNWGFIRGVMSSIADVAVAPMQDFLNIGNEGRMNLPSSLGGNWSWRMKSGATSNSLADRIRYMNYRYGRNNYV